MRKTLATLLVMASLLAGCKDGEPIIPELKGRWDVISLHNQSGAPRVASLQPPAVIDHCNVTYITFTKQGVVMRTLGIPLTVFPLTEARRQGDRVTLTSGTEAGKMMLLMRNGELRFDDVFDRNGRSVKHMRLPEDNNLRRKGATTVGEAFGLLLDLKPCKA